MLIDVGNYVHVMERRRFDTDLRRHFFGVVEAVAGSAMRVAGYAFVYDSGKTAYVRSAERRTRVMPIASSGLVINIAPSDTRVDEVRYEELDGRLTVTDGGSFSLDINEFGRNR